ncbi:MULTISPECIES: hypothetical protein [unclassified Micromonospora]|uniref:hypothetical protein n=1 Tax=unclassified Micromonospora TaxID=2617518 RepID=UPI00332854D3
MVELFRFIQKAVVVPVDGGSIDLTTTSTFQDQLRDLITSGQPHSAVRTKAEQFLNTLTSSGLSRAANYRTLRKKLLDMLPTSPTPAKIDQAVKDVLGVNNAQSLVGSQAFANEKQLSSDVLVAVKITTRFDRVDTPTIATMRVVIAFLEDFVAGRVTPLTADTIVKLLERPLRFPEAFLPPEPTPAASLTVTSPPDDEAARTASLVVEQEALQRAYDLLMTVRPGQLAVTGGTAEETGNETAYPGDTSDGHATSNQAVAAPSVLGVSQHTLEALDPTVLEHLRAELFDVGSAALTDILEVVKRRWFEVSREVEPGKVPAPARTYRLGAHVFAVQEPAPSAEAAPEEEPTPDFSHAVTRPVGVGDLQVVRQELIGYVPAEISHIENVLPRELVRRTTKREETSELVVTEEIGTTQSQERDTQTTQRNELAVEAQNEAGQESFSTQEQTSTSNYGRLVENSKTNYARSVTDRAVNKVTQSVQQQRIQREKRVYTDEVMHEINNTQGPGQHPIRGLYQWVDKKYKAKVLNYGKRLLYDVVVPEPAAFLIKSLKTAAQPENFQLVRPAEPAISPSALNAANYMYWAAQYGVTGAVTPPPPDLITTVAHSDAGKVTEKTNPYEGFFTQHFSQFRIRIPDGYRAIGGYVQRTNHNRANETEHKKLFEFFIGENTFLRFGANDIDRLNKSFTLNDESGEIPVTVRTFEEIVQFNYAVGINCRLSPDAYGQWQLKTHAQIVAGYHRQRAEYLDQLSRHQAAVRTQMALAHGFSRDTGMERQELKKAFIHLLMSEHFGAVYYPTPNPESFPPDPHYIKAWGAVVAFFERAFEWEHLMYVYYPYFWGRSAKWGELILIQDLDPGFEAFLKAGAARIVVPVRPGYEATLAHFHETGDVWMGEEIPDMFSERYVSIIAEIKARNANADQEVCVEEWEVRLPTTLVMLREDDTLPVWTPTPCNPAV